MKRHARRSVLFVPAYYHMISSLENDLELMQRHLDAGDRCDVLLYRHRVATLAKTSPDWGQYICQVDRLRQGMKRLVPALKAREVRLWPSLRLPREFSDAVDSGDIARVKQFHWNNLDCGYGVLSNLISTLMEPRPDIAANARFLKLQAGVSIALYEDLREQLRRAGADRVYTFNGRYCLARATIRACEAEGVTYVLHERGCDYEHFALFENTLPHDFDHFLRRVEEEWCRADSSDREERAKRFFEERRYPTAKTPYSYTLHQKRGTLPPGWDARQRNCVFFVSSDNEYEAIGPDWNSRLYPDQTTALRQIADVFHTLGRNDRFWVRAHPNLQGVESSQIRAMRELAAEGRIRFIEADDPVDTYALVEQAHRVVAFRSTVGVEATFWRRPVLLLAPALYRGLNAAYEPRSHQETVALLRTSDLSPKPRLGSLKYGYYRSTFGDRFKYFLDNARERGLFKGRKIEASVAHRRARRYYSQRVLPFVRNGIRRGEAALG